MRPPSLDEDRCPRVACAAPTAKLEVAGADADRREKSPDPRATEPALNSTLSRLRRTKPG